MVSFYFDTHFSNFFYSLQVITRNLNKVIDINYYPVPEAKKSNLRHRPIGIGVQGLADAFILMRFVKFMKVIYSFENSVRGMFQLNLIIFVKFNLFVCIFLGIHSIQTKQAY